MDETSRKSADTQRSPADPLDLPARQASSSSNNSAGSTRVSSPSTTHTSSTDVCKFFLKGACTRGAGCSFVHPADLAITQPKTLKHTEPRTYKTHKGHGGATGEGRSSPASASLSAGFNPSSTFGASQTGSQSRAMSDGNPNPRGNTLFSKPHAFDKQVSESWNLPGPSINPSDTMNPGGSLSSPQLVLGSISFAPAWLGKKRAQQQQLQVASTSSALPNPTSSNGGSSISITSASSVGFGTAQGSFNPENGSSTQSGQIGPDSASIGHPPALHSPTPSTIWMPPNMSRGDSSMELESTHASSSSRSLKSMSKSSISTVSTHTSGNSSYSLLSAITRTSGSSASGHSHTSSAETSSSSAHSSSSRDSGSSGSIPPPRIKKRMNTATSLQQNTGGSMTDVALLGGSMTHIHSGRGKKFPNKLAMMRWTQNFLGPGCDPTSVLLQREDLVELLQQPSLPFSVIAELMKIFAHHEFRDTGRTDRILQIVAESTLIRNPKNLKAHLIKLSGAHPPATPIYEENLSNTVDVISDIMDRYPQYIEILGLDILQISSQKIAAAYPKHISSACEAVISKGKALLSEVGAVPMTGANQSIASLAFASGFAPIALNEHDELALHGSDEEGSNFSLDDEPQTRKRGASPLSAVEDFRDLPLFPSIDEIMDDSSTMAKRLGKNIVKGKYDSLMHYLDTHFRLLREDAITSIRDGIKQYRNGQSSSKGSSKPSEVSLYHSVRLTGICPTFSGIVYRVTFKLENDGQSKTEKKTHSAQVDWKRSKRLLYGSLICVSPDNFETLFWATVANRDVSLLASRQEIDLRFPEEYQACMDPSLKYTMVESNSTYFEAYRHVLTALKSTNIHTFPFLDYLVHCKTSIDEPSYLKTGSAVYNLANIFDGDASAINILDQSWPASKIHTTMDDSQLLALKQALTKEIAIIQGPPGTGKTFVGLKVIRALLDNRDARGIAATGPILVVCYTNHALDQFLEGIIQFESNVVRIGSRSKSELLKDRNLKSLLMETNTATVEHIRARRQLLVTMKEVQETIELRFMDLCKTTLASADLLQVCEDEEQISLLFGQSLGQESEELALQTWLGISTSDLVKQARTKPAFSQRHQGALFDAEFPSLQRSGSGSTSSSSGSNSHRTAPISPSPSSGAVLGDWIDDDDNEDEFLEQVEEIDRMVGDSVLLKMTHLKQEGLLSSDVYDPVDELLLTTTNVWKLAKPDRQRLYLTWMRTFRTRIVNPDLVDLCDRYEHLCSQKNVLDQDAQVQLLMSSAVIGLTTTGVAKFQKLIRAVGPPIVIVEEAAEVLEAHIVTAITPSTKHLILIGDHEQLRPSTAVYRLALKYKLDVSLFERLIANGVPVKTLSRQRRMRPTIAATVAPIYPNLSNHPDVESYPNVLGVAQNVFFIDHSMPESADAESQGLSKTNPHEANFFARFASHLVLQGYSEKQVTILTAYSGQVKLIRQELRALNLHSVYVTSVDNYQGQECDIICLSLVRNNAKGAIGFLSTSNRICVALSRARLGMYVLGSAGLLATSNDLWRTVLDILTQNASVGTSLTLQCQTHPEKRSMVATAADFRQCEDGGCDLKCAATLECGHACPRLCHPYPHSKVLCQLLCERIHMECGHRCARLCFQDCGPCESPVLRSLPCGHDCLLPCADEEALCNKTVTHTLPCSHTIQALCRELNPSKPGKAPKSYTCTQCATSTGQH